MATMTRRNVLAAAGVTTVAGTTALLGDDKVTKQRYLFQNIPPRELIRQRHLPNVELVTMDGQKVHFYDDLVKDKRVVIQFMYTRCKDICPVITHNLAEVQRMLDGRVGRDMFSYSVTLSTEEDTPKDLRALAQEHGAEPGGTIVTG